MNQWIDSFTLPQIFASLISVWLDLFRLKHSLFSKVMPIYVKLMRGLKMSWLYWVVSANTVTYLMEPQIENSPMHALWISKIADSVFPFFLKSLNVWWFQTFSQKFPYPWKKTCAWIFFKSQAIFKKFKGKEIIRVFL